MLIYDNTGPGASPELIQGETAAVDAINKSGGIKGRTLDLIVCATQNNPNTADACARSWAGAGLRPLHRIGVVTADPAQRTLGGHDLAQLGWQHRLG